MVTIETPLIKETPSSPIAERTADPRHPTVEDTVLATHARLLTQPDAAPPLSTQPDGAPETSPTQELLAAEMDRLLAAASDLATLVTSGVSGTTMSDIEQALQDQGVDTDVIQPLLDLVCALHAVHKRKSNGIDPEKAHADIIKLTEALAPLASLDDSACHFLPRFEGSISGVSLQGIINRIIDENILPLEDFPYRFRDGAYVTVVYTLKDVFEILMICEQYLQPLLGDEKFEQIKVIQQAQGPRSPQLFRWQCLGRAIASIDFEGHYKSFLRSLSSKKPLNIVNSLVGDWNSRNRFPEQQFSATVQGNQATIRMKGSMKIVPEFCAFLGAYFQEVIDMACQQPGARVSHTSSQENDVEVCCWELTIAAPAGMEG